MILPIIRTFVVITIGIFSGYIFQKIIDKRNLIKPESKKNISVFLQKMGMLGLVPITYIGSLWILNIESLTEIFSLPFVGAASIVIGGYLAVLIARISNYKRIQIGSMFSCGFFSNLTSLGGMICFFYLGEEGYALVPIFTFFIRVLYFGYGYPKARIYGDDYINQKKLHNKIIEILNDPFFYIGIGSVFVGIFLNISSVQRPHFYGRINEILIPLTTFILLFSVGLNLKFSKIYKYLKECIQISIVKFIIVPTAILLISLLFGYESINNGLPLKVALILSAMPVAFNSVIAANIYNLNIDLVNSCWIFTTFALLLVLPVILTIVNLF